jgi:arsenate reductase
MKYRIYHNPRCSKSRATLELLKERGLDPEIIEYLKTPPNAATLRQLAQKLDVAPKALVRTGEEEFKAAPLDLDTATDAQIIDLLVRTPRLLQRPIVEIANAARIGRPPERVLELFE